LLHGVAGEFFFFSSKTATGLRLVEVLTVFLVPFLSIRDTEKLFAPVFLFFLQAQSTVPLSPAEML